MQIMDQGGGIGIFTFRIGKRFPHARRVGGELRDEYLRIAREKTRSSNWRRWKAMATDLSP